MALVSNIPTNILACCNSVEIKAAVLASSATLGTSTNHKLGFTTNNTLRATLDTSGNLGIGTDSPGAKLDVRGTVILNESGGDYDVRMEGNTYTNLFFLDASTDRIGIGTATPSHLLDVEGVANFATCIVTPTVCTTGDTVIGGDLTVAGDDITLGTNTSGYIIVADGVNYNPVAVSGDVTISSAGAITIAATSVENSMLAGSIANAKLSNSSVSYGGVSVSLGSTDATPAFDLADATNYPTSNLVGTITNAQLAGSIANAKLSNSSVSYGGVSVSLGSLDATPAFDLADATNYPTSSLVGTITNAQLAGSIVNAKLTNSSVSYGGVSVSLGASDGTPAFNLSDATAYLGDSSLVTVGAISSGTWQGTAVATEYIATTLTGKTLTSPVLNGTLSGTAFLDEDNFASDSAGAAASQQSIKAYVDAVASGLDLKSSSHVATTCCLTSIYSNGSSGVGATLTNAGAQAVLSVDGQTMVAAERVLIKDQTAACHNGIYTVTTIGTISTNWVITRATDFDTTTEVTSGSFTFTETGTTNADAAFVMTTDGTITIGTTAINWTQFSGAGQITAGAGLTKNGSIINVGAGSNITVNADDVALSTTITGLSALTSTAITGTLQTAAQANVTSVGTLTSLCSSGDITLGGDLTIAGDDLFMTTNTSGYLLIADGTNYNPTAVSGDVTINSLGATTIGATTVTNAMLAGSIANAKLSNSSVSYGGISVSLGGADATPAFDLADATNYPTSSLVGTITNAQLAGSIANAKLSNSSVSYGGISVSLGSADATPAFNLTDATSYPTSSLVGTITNAQLAGSIANGKLANSTITIADGGINSTAISLGGTMRFNGTANEVEVTESTGTLTIGLPATVSGLTSVSATNLTGTLATAAQANVTSVGTLTSLAVSGDITIDTATLKVNSTTNRVGIGTATPSHLLDVEGVVNVVTCVITPVYCVASQYVLPTSDGTIGQVICTDGIGGLSFATNTPASPGGSDTYVQFNEGGSAFGGSANFTWDDTTVKASNFCTAGTATLATVDINAGAIDGTTIGAASAAAGTFLAIVGTTLTASGNVSFDGGTFVFNESGADKDFRIEGDTAVNLFIVDASTDRIGVGTATPSHLVDIEGVAHASTCFVSADLCATTKVVAAAICMGGAYALPSLDGTAGYILCTDGSGTISFAAAASGGHTIAEEGTPLTSRTCLNFIGAAVAATDNSVTNATDVTIGSSSACILFTTEDGSTDNIVLTGAATVGELACDSSPALGGNLDVTGYNFYTTSNNNICLAPNGTGKVCISSDLLIAGDDLYMATNTSGYILVADGTNYNPVAVSGDVTISSAGAITIAAGAVENSMLANCTISYGGVQLVLGGIDATPAFNLSDATAYVGDSALVTVGTIASGTWQGTAIATGYIAGTLASKTLSDPVLTGTISGNAFLDEDNMASDSATKVASQQSIKAYVDSVASGLDIKFASHTATTAGLTSTYSNGSSGVGATLTNAGTQAALSIDGQTMVAAERVLIKDQTAACHNGIYTVTTVGDGLTNWVVTRATDFDGSTEVTSGEFTFVETGTTNADSGWVMTTDGTVTIGTTAINWSQFSGAGQITAGAGLTKSANTLAVGAGSNITVNADDVALSTTITGLTALTATTLTGTLATAAQTNVTSLGSLSSLCTSGDICVGADVHAATCIVSPAYCVASGFAFPTADGTAGYIMCTDGSGTVAWVTNSTGHVIAEEGTPLSTRSCLNFIGTAVTATDNSVTDATDVTITAENADLPSRLSNGTQCCITLSSAAVGDSLVSDTTPQLGGNLDVNGKSIVSAVGSNGNIPITPNGSGVVIVDGICHPTADGSAGQVICTNGSAALQWATVSTDPAGSDTYIQFNDGGAFGSSANLTWDDTTLKATGNIVNVNGSLISCCISMTSSQKKGEFLAVGCNTAGSIQEYGSIVFCQVTASGGGRGNASIWLNDAGTLTERFRMGGDDGSFCALSGPIAASTTVCAGTAFCTPGCICAGCKITAVGSITAGAFCTAGGFITSGVVCAGTDLCASRCVLVGTGIGNSGFICNSGFIRLTDQLYFCNSTSSAAGTLLGSIRWCGCDAAGNIQPYGCIGMCIGSSASLDECAVFQVKLTIDCCMKTATEVNATGICTAYNVTAASNICAAAFCVAAQYVLPSADGSAGQLMCTNGSGALAFATAASAVTLSGSTNNTIATVTGANALIGEANLTFDGTNLSVGDGGSVRVFGGGATTIDADASNAVGTGASYFVNSPSSGQSIVVVAVDAHSSAAGITGLKTRATNATNANTIVVDGDDILRIQALAADGAAYVKAGEIKFEVDGTPGTNDMPGRIVFGTTADGAAGTTERMRIDSAGAITTPTNPAFMNRYGGHHANATGDGTSVTLNGNTEVYDRNADHDPSTGAFTAPVAGLYQFSAGIYLEGLTSSHTDGFLNISSTNSGGVKTSYFNPWAIRSSNTVMVWTYDIVFNLASGDVVTATMGISGGTKVVDLQGSVNITNYFSGQLIG